ncbi:MAG: methyl-accepting chemotaxis protein [Spirochaetaceae bacterium]|nr:methyl-accepting chemotaxis protein [Spirochaetaceae bacterium]
MKKGGKPTSLGKRIVALCLSLIVLLSSVWITLVLVNMAGVSGRNLQRQAELAMHSLEANVQNALQPAIDMAEHLSVLVPELDSPEEELRRLLPALLPVYPPAFEIFYASAASRFAGGVLLTATGWDPYVNPAWDQVERPWFIQSLTNPGKTVITEPYEDSNTGRICISLVRSVQDRSGRFMGVVGMDMFLDTLTNIVKNLGITEDGETFIVSAEGLILVHPNYDWVRRKNIFTLFDGAENTHHRFLIQREDLLKGTTITVRGSQYVASIALSFAPWHLVSLGTIRELTKDFRWLLLFIMVSTLVMAAVAAVIAFIFGKNLTVHINKLYSVLKTIAQGDLTAAIEPKNRDEIGEMTRLLALTQVSMADLVGDIKKESSALSGVGTKLATTMVETATAVHEITATIESIKKQSAQQTENIAQTGSILRTAANNADTLNQQINRQVETIRRSSETIGGMIAGIVKMVRIIREDETHVTELEAALTQGRQGVQSMSIRISEIAQESDGLLDITAVLANIAGQTNLLAMNATIESVHAGEVGRGFAVVADEIRKLAESSAVQSKTIATVLKKTKGMIDSIASLAGDVIQEFETIDQNIQNVAASTEEMHNAVTRQEAGSREVSYALEELETLSSAIHIASQEVRDGSEEILQENQVLSELSFSISSGMDEISSRANQINATVHQVQTLSTANRESIGSLIKGVDKFKV